jgi:hypothetical protein
VCHSARQSGSEPDTGDAEKQLTWAWWATFL